MSQAYLIVSKTTDKIVCELRNDLRVHLLSNINDDSQLSPFLATEITEFRRDQILEAVEVIITALQKHDQEWQESATWRAAIGITAEELIEEFKEIKNRLRSFEPLEIFFCGPRE